jgi:hypothetical protein
MGGESEAGGDIMITVIRSGSHGSNDATGASRRPCAILRSSCGKCDAAPVAVECDIDTTSSRCRRVRAFRIGTRDAGRATEKRVFVGEGTALRRVSVPRGDGAHDRTTVLLDFRAGAFHVVDEHGLDYT